MDDSLRKEFALRASKCFPIRVALTEKETNIFMSELFPLELYSFLWMHVQMVKSQISLQICASYMCSIS